MEKKKLLICGASGFLGRNALEFFLAQKEYEVYALEHKRPVFQVEGVKILKGDLLKEDDVRRVLQDIDVVVQAAATTSGSKDIVERPYIHVTDNAVMNSLLFRAAHDCGVRHTIFFSCSIMYQSSDKPLKESDFDANDDIYPKYFGAGWTKIYIEKVAEFFAGLGKTKYTVIRHSNIYGPHDKFDLERSHVFGATVTKVMTAEGEIIVWGTGEEARDLLYVDDLMNLVTEALKKQESEFELINAGLGEAVQIKDLVQKIIKASGKTIKVKHDLSMPSIPTSLFLDCGRAFELFGWEPQTDIDTGIRKTLDWYKKELL